MERRFQKKQTDPPTLFLSRLQIGPGPSNDQKLVILSYIIGESMKRRFQKVQKNLDLPHPLLTPPKNRSWAQKWARTGVHWVWSFHIPLQSIWKDFNKSKKMQAEVRNRNTEVWGWAQYNNHVSILNVIWARISKVSIHLFNFSDQTTQTCFVPCKIVTHHH